MRINYSGRWLLPAVMALCVAGTAWSQTAEHDSTLIVVGQRGQAAVTQMNGKSYVDIASLARLLNGSLSFAGNQVRLTLPASAATTAPAANVGLSKDFVRAAIEETSTIREWRSVIADIIQHSYPFDENWFTGYSDEAAKNLRLASLAASTESDRSAFQLLANELKNMQALTETVLENRKVMRYMPPDYLDNNPLNRKILACAHSLASMAANEQFADDGACH